MACICGDNRETTSDSIRCADNIVALGKCDCAGVFSKHSTINRDIQKITHLTECGFCNKQIIAAYPRCVECRVLFEDPTKRVIPKCGNRM